MEVELDDLYSPFKPKPFYDSTGYIEPYSTYGSNLLGIPPLKASHSRSITTNETI